MFERFDPYSIPLTAAGSLALSRQLLAIKQTPFLVTLGDAQLTLTAKWLMVNLFTWRPLVKRRLPITQRHTLSQEIIQRHHGVPEGLVTPRVLAAVQTAIYDDVIAHTLVTQGRVPPELDNAILYDVVEIVNDLHTMVATQLGEYHLSISAFELADLLLSPEIAALTTVDVEAELKIGITATEDKIRSAGKQIMERLKDRKLPSNVLAPFLELGQLSDKQLPAVVQAIGYRTDASDNHVRRPIMTSYIRGMQDILDFATEALMAKKTVYYNKNAMPDQQYSNRKQQILSSVVWHLYPGDCGSTITVPYYVHRDNAKNVLDKNIVANGQILRLTKHNIANYIGTTVQFRSPLTCRHTDGICQVCGGHLTHYMPPDSVVGLSCTIEYMANVSQLVLSAKHFTSTKAIAYKVPDYLQDLLVVKQNDIYLREGVDLSRLKIGVQFQDIPHINELSRPDDDLEVSAPIGEQQFSSIHYVTFADSDTDSLLTPEVSMTSDGAVPYFSKEILSHIEGNFKSVEIIGDMVWIPLKRFDHVNEPMFRCVVQSNSMIKFSGMLSKFATSDIRKYTNLTDALRDFSELVYREVQANVFHIEVVLKSYLITSETDYAIPVVTNIDDVKFGTLVSIIPRRSLGGMYAYERLAQYLTEPETYIFGHPHGIFDTFFFE